MTNWSVITIFLFIYLANTSRNVFVTAHFKGKLSLGTGHVTIKRTYIMMLLDCILLRQAIVDQIPILVQLDDEEGVNFGGVCRDFSGFWEEAYQLVMLALISNISLSLVRFCHMAIFVVDFFLHAYPFQGWI